VGAPNVGKSSLLNALAGRAAAIVSPHPGTTRDAVRVELVLGGVPVTLVDTAGLRETDDPIESEGIRRAREEAETADFVLAVIDADGNVSQGPRGLVVANKVDLAAPRHGALGVSALTGQGLSALRDRLTDVALKLAGAGASPTFNRARHAAALRDAVAFLIAARAARQPELRADEIRAALDALGRISGKVTTEAVLDVVFAAFCIGK
jgi:tRNA modification GTPase